MAKDRAICAMFRARRIALGLSQLHLAETLGRSRHSIQCWEKGSSSPCLQVFLQWAAALGFETLAAIEDALSAQEPPNVRDAMGTPSKGPP